LPAARRVNDLEFVREQYAAEDRLRSRKSVYENAEGDDPREFAFQAIAAARPRRVLEVGGGEGELAERVQQELGAEVTGLDQSPRMVELQRARGIDARVGGVEELQFADASFDVAVAAWMLHHVPQVDRALAELARVLQPRGRLVVVTNAGDSLKELHDLVRRRDHFRFQSERAEEALLRHFANVDRRDVRGWLTMDNDTIRRYLASWYEPEVLVDVAPRDEPLRVRRHSTVFVAKR
jgi:ubiquinone/menaquinone biosynthesis C-methylase UbiE